MVARLLWVQDPAGSIPVTPTSEGEGSVVGRQPRKLVAGNRSGSTPPPSAAWKMKSRWRDTRLLPELHRKVRGSTPPSSAGSLGNLHGGRRPMVGHEIVALGTRVRFPSVTLRGQLSARSCPSRECWRGLHTAGRPLAGLARGRFQPHFFLWYSPVEARDDHHKLVPRSR